MTLFGKQVPILLSLLIWCLVWEVIGRAKLSTIVPPFSAVLAAGITILPTAKFSTAVSISLRSFLIGMSLALAIGVPLGVIMARIPSAKRILGMWVNIFVSAPISALVPILMAVIGIGEATVIITVFLFAVFVIILDTEVGIRGADQSLVEMARCFGARPVQVYTKILFLCALPEMLAGIRLGAIRGVKGVVIGQLLIAILGVGELFELYSENFLMEEFWALVIIVFLFAFAVSEAVAFIERRVDYYASAR